MRLPFSIFSDFHSLFKCCALESITNGVISCTVLRSDHLNVFPEPMAKARQTLISSSIGDLVNIVPVVVVAKIGDVKEVGIVDVGKPDDVDVEVVAVAVAVGTGDVVNDESDTVDGCAVVFDNDALDSRAVAFDNDDVEVVEDDDVDTDEDNVIDVGNEDGAGVKNDCVVVVDRVSDIAVIFGINSILLYFLIPFHFIFVVVCFDDGNVHDNMERC
jgi:hypothetical protein